LTTVYLGLGSNTGDRAAMLEAALERLEIAGVRIARRSPVIETEPQYVLEQPRFLNMVVEARTTLEPAALLQTLQRIETALGRRKIVNKGPRTIDIDILFHGGAIVDTPGLTIPHPLLHERRFVLEPLCEIAPGLQHPVTGKTAAEMLAALD